MIKTSTRLQEFIAERKKEDIHYGRNPFLTLSRQAGAGGRNLAQEIQRQIEDEAYSDLTRGWRIFDRELCEEVANDPNLQVSLQSLLTEEYHSQIEEFVNDLMGNRTPQFTVYRKIMSLIRTLASVGKVIVIGRGASCVTRDMRGGVHIRLVASVKTRSGRMAKLLGISKEEAQRTLEKQDRDRARFLKDFFGKDIEDPLLYDAVWNTDTVPLSHIASSVLHLITAKTKEHRPI